MKHLFKYALLTLFSTFLFASCELQSEIVPASKSHSLTLDATLTTHSRTYLGEFDGSAYPVLWEDEGEEVKLIEWPSTLGAVGMGTPNQVNSDIITVYNSGANATFSFELPALDYSADLFHYGAIYSDAYELIDNNQKLIELTIPTEQTPSEGQFDKVATAMVAYSPNNSTRAEQLNVHFKHVGAYAILDVENLNLADDEEVSSVTIASSEHTLAGRIGYCFEDDALTPAASDAEHSVTINTTNVEVSTTGGIELFFVTHPTDFVEGDHLTFTIQTNKHTYTKSVAITSESAFSLTRGEILHFGVDYAMVEADPLPRTTYELVTDASLLKSGDQILMVISKNSVAVTAGPLYSNSLPMVTLDMELTGTEPAEQLVLSADLEESVVVFTLGRVYTEDLSEAWTLTGSDKGAPIAVFAQNSDNINYQTPSNPDQSYWFITNGVSNSNTLKINNVAFADRYLTFNNSTDIFKAYKESSTHLHPYIYRKML